jgi:tetratricopeptide (TPR) repeat protein
MVGLRLSEVELGKLLLGRPADVVHAIWLATGGLPETALALAALSDSADGDPVAALALRAPSQTQFLVPDVALLRLLETAAAQSLPPEVRAQVLIRWAGELLSNPAAADQRQELADEAVRLARDSGDPGVLAQVLDGRLHALWDPAAAAERLSTAAQIIELARQAGDAVVELQGLFWRFMALVELADLDAAEAALMLYGRTGELAGDAQTAVVVRSRQAALAIARGRLELAAALTDEVAATGERLGLADTPRLTATLAGQLEILRGNGEAQIPLVQEIAVRLPGHYYEATAARVMAEVGRDAEALLELDRLLPTVLAGTGPRWLGAVADLAFVASRGGDSASVEQLYNALRPYSGRLVVWGGANTITGPVDDRLGRLAGRLGRSQEALEHFDRAVVLEERLGALTWLSATLAVRGRPGDRDRSQSLATRIGIVTAPTGHVDQWTLLREGDEWFLEAGAEAAHLRHVRGLSYLRKLVSVPGQEITALDLVADGVGLPVAPGHDVLDIPARKAYRTRLAALEGHLDEADRAGDATQAQTLMAERDALVGELRKATGIGGRPRLQPAEADRARVNATRALGTVLNRLESVAPLAAAYLRASIRTGNHFRYQPSSTGPQRWRVS